MYNLFQKKRKKMKKNVKISTEMSDPPCPLKSLTRFLRERCPMSS